jgi:hypothetical protein
MLVNVIYKNIYGKYVVYYVQTVHTIHCIFTYVYSHIDHGVLRSPVFCTKPVSVARGGISYLLSDLWGNSPDSLIRQSSHLNYQLAGYLPI